MDTARDLGHAHVVGSRERCQPRTAADGKSVTESNLSLGAPAQNIRLMRGLQLFRDDRRRHVEKLICGT